MMYTCIHCYLIHTEIGNRCWIIYMLVSSLIKATMGYVSEHLHKGNVFGCLLFLVLFLATAETLQSLTPCPSSCHCSVLSDRTVKAVCRLGNKRDYSAVTRLPSNMTELVCVVKSRLDQDSLELKSLWRLRKLVIKPEKLVGFRTAIYTGMTVELKRNDLLQNLSSLSSLGIHIPVSFLSPQLLDPVPTLEVLDLSYSFT